MLKNRQYLQTHVYLPIHSYSNTPGEYLVAYNYLFLKQLHFPMVLYNVDIIIEVSQKVFLELIKSKLLI